MGQSVSSPGRNTLKNILDDETILDDFDRLEAALFSKEKEEEPAFFDETDKIELPGDIREPEVSSETDRLAGDIWMTGWIDPLLQLSEEDLHTGAIDQREILRELPSEKRVTLETGVIDMPPLPEDADEEVFDVSEEDYLDTSEDEYFDDEDDLEEELSADSSDREFITPEYDDYEEDDAGEEYEEEETLGERIAGFFSSFGPMEYIMAGTGVVILVLALVVGGNVLARNRVQEQQDEIAQLGSDIYGRGEEGVNALYSFRDAMNLRAAAAEAEAEESEETREEDTEGEIPVEFRLSSIQSDLKIKFLNSNKNALIADAPFLVTVKLPGGGTETWEDDDRDGIIYKTGLSNGTYEVSSKSFADEAAYKKFSLPTLSQTISVTDQIAYQKVDVSDEIKKESEVNTAAEDTAKKDTVVESTIKDTVEWVESTKTEVSEGGYSEETDQYEEVSKDNIKDPYLSAALSRGSLVRLSAASISISGSSSGKVGDSISLSASVTENDEGGHGDISWESDNTGVASVSGNGESATVSLVSAGTAAITAKCDDQSGVITITVSEGEKEETKSTVAVTGVSLDYTEISGTVGDVRSLSPSITPSDASDKSVSWSSSNPDIVSVDGGTLTMKAEGTAEITVKSSDGGYTSTCKVKVSAKTSNIAVTGITLDMSSMTGTVGGSASLTATIAPSDASNRNVTWMSDNTAVATVSSGGKVSYVSAGTAAITVKTEDGGKTAVCTVTVKSSANDSDRLKDKDGNELYVKDGDSYRAATAADYNNYSTFYKKVRSTAQYRYTGWQTIDGKTYFFNKNGEPVTGDQVIQGISYHFDSTGAMSSTSNTAGIDVSKWNGTIDWKAVKSSGISFAIIRCGYRGSSVGALIEDSMFRTNITGAKNAGLKVGVYFFSQAVTEAEAVEEASMVLSTVSSYGVNMPIFLDVESSGGRGDTVSVSQRTKNIKAFCQTIQNSGYSAGVYANTNWFSEKINVGELTSYHIWLAQYAEAPTYSRSRYDLWQYSAKGKVSGISGDVDMDIAYRSY